MCTWWEAYGHEVLEETVTLIIHCTLKMGFDFQLRILLRPKKQVLYRTHLRENKITVLDLPAPLGYVITYYTLAWKQKKNIRWDIIVFIEMYLDNACQCFQIWVAYFSSDHSYKEARD